MFKLIAFTALLAIAAAAPGFLETAHVAQEPVLTKVGAVVVHTVPAATSHSSFTQVHNGAKIVTPIVKTVAPVASVHHVSAPAVVKVVHAAPVVHTVHAAPSYLKTVHAAPVVHHVATPPVVKTVLSAPVVHAVHAAPVVQSYAHFVPVVKPIVNPVVHHVPAPASYQSHVQIHQHKAFSAPVVAATVLKSVDTPVVYTTPIVKSVISAPVTHVVHH